MRNSLWKIRYGIHQIIVYRMIEGMDDALRKEEGDLRTRASRLRWVNFSKKNCLVSTLMSFLKAPER